MQEKANPPISVQVFGAISFWGKSRLVFLEGTQKDDDYKQTLEEFLEHDPMCEWESEITFCHDNSPIHTCRSVQRLFPRKGIKLDPIPAASPELNPIEYVWSHMKRDMPHPLPMTKAGLREEVQSAWDRLERSQIRNMIGKLSDTKRKIIKAKGGHIPRE